jgi:hypothetical protein
MNLCKIFKTKRVEVENMDIPVYFSILSGKITERNSQVTALSATHSV